MKHRIYSLSVYDSLRQSKLIFLHCLLYSVRSALDHQYLNTCHLDNPFLLLFARVVAERSAVHSRKEKAICIIKKENVNKETTYSTSDNLMALLLLIICGISPCSTSIAVRLFVELSAPFHKLF